MNDHWVVPRRFGLFVLGRFPPRLFPVSAERTSVPSPNPRLARVETSFLIASIDSSAGLTSGSERPSNSQRIFGLYAGLVFFLVDLLPFQTLDMLLHLFLVFRLFSVRSRDDPVRPDA
jgi:hypothetical protein